MSLRAHSEAGNSSMLSLYRALNVLQVIQLKIPFTPLYYGTGIISVIGISFTFLPLAQSSIGYMMVMAHADASASFIMA